MSRNAELFDAMLKVAVGVLILAAWTYVVLDQRDLRRALRRQRTQLHQYRRAIVQLQGAATQPPTSVGQPMPTVGRRLAQGGIVRGPALWGREEGCELLIPGPTAAEATRALIAGARTIGVDLDPTLRLARPPALSDLAAAILGADRPLTRATLDAKLDRDTRTEVRNGLLAGTLQMVRTHDDEPAYWPTSHPVPGDTVRMAKMPVLPGISR